MKQDIPCVRSKTFPVFEAGHSLCSKQDIPCVRNRTFLVFEAGHSLCCEQKISCVPITNNAHAIFWWIQPIVPGFGRIVIRFAQILGRSAELAKKWRANFRTSNGSKIARIAPIWMIFWRNWSRLPDPVFQKMLRGRKCFRRQRRDFLNCRSRRRDPFRQKLVEIGAILAIFEPFEVFGGLYWGGGWARFAFLARRGGRTIRGR